MAGLIPYSDSEDDSDPEDGNEFQQRHQPPSNSGLEKLCSSNWSLNEVMHLVQFASVNNGKWNNLSSDPILSQRHNNPDECNKKLDEIMKYQQKANNPSKSSSLSGSIRPQQNKGNKKKK